MASNLMSGWAGSSSAARRSASHCAAMARTRPRLTWPIESNGESPPLRPRMRVLTSQKIKQRSPAAMMSSSPWRVRKLRSTIR